MLGHLLGRHLLGVARRVAIKHHDAVADRGRVDTRLPLEFLEYIPQQVLVVLHLGPPPHRSVRSTHAGYSPCSWPFDNGLPPGWVATHPGHAQLVDPTGRTTSCPGPPRAGISSRASWAQAW